jgi:type II secretion system protein H
MDDATRKRLAAGGRGFSAARGFTLLELMIVLAILAMLIAMVWPSLRRPVMRSVAQQAARQLVKDLARARMAAIDSGQIVALRFELGGTRYVVQLAESLGDSEETAPEITAEHDAGNAAVPDTPADFGFEAQLDEDVVFRDPSETDQNEFPTGSALGEMLEDERKETEKVKPLIDNEKAEQAFSTPVFFYPTGRAENAAFVLQGPDGYRVTVKLRGLTGAASIGPLEHTLRSVEVTDESGKMPDRSAPPEEFKEPDVSDK